MLSYLHVHLFLLQFLKHFAGALERVYDVVRQIAKERATNLSLETNIVELGLESEPEWPGFRGPNRDSVIAAECDGRL